MSTGPGSLPFSEACERNKEPILDVLRTVLPAEGRVLEIGSGTGQHVVHFAKHLPGLVWQPTDRGSLEGLRARIAREAPPNVLAPFELDVRGEPWPAADYDAVFSANTLHIMDWESVRHFFRGVRGALHEQGLLCVYGPFSYGGRHTSPSNAAFDRSLRARDPASGIRDFDSLQELARARGLAFVADHALPANNRLLIWQLDGSAPAR